MKTDKEKIREMVKDAWETLCFYTTVFGGDCEITNNARRKWAIIDDIWNELYDEEY